MYDLADTAVVSLAEVERRIALTRGSGRLGIQDQLDWGQELLAAGDRAGALLLIEAGFLQQGFSPQLERSRTDLYAALGIDAAPRVAAVSDKDRGNTVDIAIAELRAFAAAHGQRIATSLADSMGSVVGAPGLHPTATLARAAPAPSGQGVAEMVGHAFAWLRSSASEQDDHVGASAVEHLRGSERDRLRLNAAGLAGAATPVLANAVAAQELRAFLRQQTDLLLPRLGSPALFHAAAGFDSNGLGPWFGNVGQIVQSSTNLFELADIAIEASGADHDPIIVQAWVALLSRDMSGWLRYDIIDELGDRNASLALVLVLERTVAVAEDDVDRSLVARIRDAALDNLNYDLAGMAQQQLLNLSRNDWLERRILGAIQASAGRIFAADQLLSACLNDHPGDEQLAQEVVANRERRFAPFAIIKGYGSPRDRQLKRIGSRARR